MWNGAKSNKLLLASMTQADAVRLITIDNEESQAAYETKDAAAAVAVIRRSLENAQLCLVSIFSGTIRELRRAIGRPQRALRDDLKTASHAGWNYADLNGFRGERIQPVAHPRLHELVFRRKVLLFASEGGMIHESMASPNSHTGCSCAAPSRQWVGELGPTVGFASATVAPQQHSITQVRVPAGAFTMGDSTDDRNPHDGERPLHKVILDAFDIDETTVTNDQFACFIDATGYRTEAEVFGYSAVFHLAVQAEQEDIMGPAAGAPWWFGVQGADWAHPGGRKSSLYDLHEHPVVHISWNDAAAYCRWADRRLPTEAEWEYASRGGIHGAKYPWGDQEIDTPQWRANIWQGDFPRRNDGDDGWLTTATAKAFEPNAYGIYQTVGNVWEWCSDWFNPRFYEQSSPANPAGPADGQSRVMRGGSYLCHKSYCNRYRNSARSSNTPDSSMGNTGFRTVAL